MGWDIALCSLAQWRRCIVVTSLRCDPAGGMRERLFIWDRSVRCRAGYVSDGTGTSQR